MYNSYTMYIEEGSVIVELKIVVRTMIKTRYKTSETPLSCMCKKEERFPVRSIFCVLSSSIHYSTTCHMKGSNLRKYQKQKWRLTKSLTFYFIILPGHKKSHYLSVFRHLHRGDLRPVPFTMVTWRRDWDLLDWQSM